MSVAASHFEKFLVGQPDEIEVGMCKEHLEHDFEFTVCTMLASDEKYRRSLAAFQQFGFTPQNTQFLAVDNRDGNCYHGYEWTRRILPECRGRYVVFCHDDVELIDDGFDELSRCLSDLTALDPMWALAGNAGGRLGWKRIEKRFRLAVRIRYPSSTNARIGTLPARCESLDENFIVMRRDQPVTGSADLSGFHLYGTDLCLRAELAGLTSYVIDFHLHRHGVGQKGVTYRQQKQRLEVKYRNIFPGRRVSTSTEIVQF